VADNTIHKFTELTTKVIARIAEIWEEGEGELNIKITDEGGVVKDKIGGVKVERV